MKRAKLLFEEDIIQGKQTPVALTAPAQRQFRDAASRVSAHKVGTFDRPSNSPRLFIDSGAFTMYNKKFEKRETNKSFHDDGTVKKQYVTGNSLESRSTGADYAYMKTSEFKRYVESYVEFIHRFNDVIDYYINLDIIFDAPKTLEMQQYLESCGLKPLPVFHYGEPMSYLVKMMDNYEHFCLAGTHHLGKKILVPALDNLWGRYLTDKDGYAIRRIHGLAQTSWFYMDRYPFYSVDSSTWKIKTCWGDLLIPHRDRTGNWDYTKEAWIVGTTRLSPNMKANNHHYSNMSAAIRHHVDDYLAYLGLTIDQCIKSVAARDTVNIRYFLGYMYSKKDHRFNKDRWRKGMLHHIEATEEVRCEMADHGNTIVYLAGLGIPRETEELIYREGGSRMLSYWYEAERKSGNTPPFLTWAEFNEKPIIRSSLA